MLSLCCADRHKPRPFRGVQGTPLRRPREPLLEVPLPVRPHARADERRRRLQGNMTAIQVHIASSTDTFVWHYHCSTEQ